jgi:hypothetical protein
MEDKRKEELKNKKAKGARRKLTC